MSWQWPPELIALFNASSATSFNEQLLVRVRCTLSPAPCTRAPGHLCAAGHASCCVYCVQAPECSVGSWSFERKFYVLQAVPLVLLCSLGAAYAVYSVWVSSSTLVRLVLGHGGKGVGG